MRWRLSSILALISMLLVQFGGVVLGGGSCDVFSTGSSACGTSTAAVSDDKASNAQASDDKSGDACCGTEQAGCDCCGQTPDQSSSSATRDEDQSASGCCASTSDKLSMAGCEGCSCEVRDVPVTPLPQSQRAIESRWSPVPTLALPLKMVRPRVLAFQRPVDAVTPLDREHRRATLGVWVI